MDSATRAFERPAVKLAAFACTLGVTLGGGALIGDAVGPEPSGSPAHDRSSPGATDATTTLGADAASIHDEAVPEGLAVSRDGHTLSLASSTFTSGAAIELAFQIVGPDGRPVREFDTAHGKELHLIVVSRDLVEFLHVHPERADDGTWTITIPGLDAGSYRVFADFTPVGAESLTLGADIAVAGEFAPAGLPDVSESSDVDGYTVALDGALVAGTGSTITMSVSADERPVTDLEPYLGALGHLVAIRTGDLAYLHVHPSDETGEPGGPDITFTVDVPSAGTYRLFLDFSHGDEVRTAAFTVNAERGDDPGPAVASTAGSDHGEH